MNRQPGRFTLIELLVVVAIIAILASLLLPALSSARGRGKRIACMNGQHQVGIAITMYADENDAYLPLGYKYTGATAFEDTWFLSSKTFDQFTNSYLNGEKGMWGCPNWVGAYPVYSSTSGGTYTMGMTYLGSKPLINQVMATSKYAYPNRLGESEKIPILGEVNRQNVAFSSTYISHRGSSSYILVGNGVDVIAAGSAGGNYSFQDGSTRWLPPSQLKRYICFSAVASVYNLYPADMW